MADDEERPPAAGLPRWPTAAKDLPDPRPPRKSRRGLYTGAGVGLVIGLVLAPLGAIAAAGQMDPEEAGRVFGRVLFPVLAGSAVGTLLDRRREKRERHWPD